jgi:hypothetical protein
MTMEFIVIVAFVYVPWGTLAMMSGCAVPASRIISNGVAELMMLTVLPFVPVKVIDPTIMEKATIRSDELSPMPTRTSVLLTWVDWVEEEGVLPLGATLLEEPPPQAGMMRSKPSSRNTAITPCSDATGLAGLTEKIMNPPHVQEVQNKKSRMASRAACRLASLP